MGTPCQIDVKLVKIEGRKNATLKDRSGATYKAPVYMVSQYSKWHNSQDGEDVKGQVMINLNKGKKLDHLGIRVELVGVIENLYDKNQNTTFL